MNNIKKMISGHLNLTMVNESKNESAGTTTMNISNSIKIDKSIS